MSARPRLLWTVLVAVWASSALTPTSAHAFSDYATFGREPLEPNPDDPTMQGGGGGRYFTGSVLDGYTCEVCHRLEYEDDDGNLLVAEAIDAGEFEVTGWPEDGYVPGGQALTLEVAFPDDVLSAGSLELVRGDGTGAGTLELVPNPQAQDICPAEPPEMGTDAVHIEDIPQNRQVAISDACAPVIGRLRARWTPPPDDVGPIWLNVAVVGSDGSADPSGDTVFTFAQLIPPEGMAVVPADLGTECAVRSGGDGFGEGWLLLSVAAVLGRRRLGRRRLGRWRRRGRRAAGRARPTSG